MPSSINLPNPGSYQQQLGGHVVAFREALQDLINDAAYLNSQGGTAFLTAPPYSFSASDATLIMSTIGAVNATNTTVEALQAFLAQTEPLWGGQ
jgi:hypothetical protein